MIVLAGDVGGTNTRLQLTEYKDKKSKVLFAKKYLAVDFKSLSAIIEKFLAESSIDKALIKAACIAVAGPVKNGAIEFTNLPWGLTETELAEVLTLDISKVKLINDFASIGYGLDSVETKDLVCLQQAPIDQNAPIAMVGAGTGIGMGIVTKHDNKTFVYPSEGGHQDFAPVDDEQIGLFQFLKKKLHRVSIERICCGPGLVNIYKYVVANPLYNQPESPELRRDMHKGGDQAQLVTQYAVEKGDPMSLRAVDIFIRVYGAVAGNMALATLPKRGLYIVGGIAPKLIKQMQDGRFMKNFHDKGRMTGLMKEIPVFVVMDTDVGIKGASAFALSLCEK
ncbi:glucokinase [Cysteiniphilum sp. QT6929]|uniref:glucokinase n=1 Tax=Cysteiniphilum sp. QT6929 TaxID=2975055 RepID=UPI0024B34D65|nr:glucokinase [Cysteiniphilum sp. QT6929]WHN65890.1 glucokinase [Cysteiniphilum sp. QT6929]